MHSLIAITGGKTLFGFAVVYTLLVVGAIVISCCTMFTSH